MAAVSVAATVDGWTVERILQERLWSRSMYATATVLAVRDAGDELLPTHRVAHDDIVLPIGHAAERQYAVAVVRRRAEQPVSPTDEVRHGIRGVDD